MDGISRQTPKDCGRCKGTLDDIELGYLSKGSSKLTISLP